MWCCNDSADVSLLAEYRLYAYERDYKHTNINTHKEELLCIIGCKGCHACDAIRRDSVCVRATIATQQHSFTHSHNPTYFSIELCRCANTCCNARNSIPPSFASSLTTLWRMLSRICARNKEMAFQNNLVCEVMIMYPTQAYEQSQEQSKRLNMTRDLNTF